MAPQDSVLRQNTRQSDHVGSASLSCADSLIADAVLAEQVPVKFHAVARALRSDGPPPVHRQLVTQVRFETESMDFEVGCIGDRGQQVHMQIVDAVRSYR